MGVESFLMSYGWLGFLGYVVVKEVWPFFRDKAWPSRIREQLDERKRLARLEERQVLADERQAKAVEGMSSSVQQMALQITTSNERLTQIMTAHVEHDRFTRQAIMDMHDRVKNADGAPAKRKKQSINTR